ncbi:MAG: hypothetical protein AAFX87_01750 [Bacteroidota bacterium]
MLEEKILELQNAIPELDISSHDNSDEILKQVIGKNEILWKVAKWLIKERLESFFVEKKNTNIQMVDNVYLEQFFGKYSTEVSFEFEKYADMTLPMEEKLIGRSLLLLPPLLAWWVLLHQFISKNIEFLLIGYQWLADYGSFLYLLPIIVVVIVAPKWLFGPFPRKFKKVKTFNDLIEQLFIINLFRYRVDNFKRLKEELIIYLSDYK